MSNTITGTIKVLRDTQIINDKFKKRDFVVETPGDYPQFIIMQMTQDKTEILDKYKEGDNVTAHINIRGREWKSPQGDIKYFNTLECWKIEGESSEAFTPENNTSDLVKDKLPF